MNNPFHSIVLASFLGAAIATSSGALLKPNPVFASSKNSAQMAESDALIDNTKLARAFQPPAFGCSRYSPCDYLYEPVSIFMRDPEGYCRRKYGGDAYVRRILGIPFCALPYDRRRVV